MSRVLRYQQPQVRQHLASHYVLGTLSARVRRRCERLLQQDPELEAAIYHWQSQMNQINDSVDPVTPPSRVWPQVEAQINPTQVDPGSGSGLWFALPFWRSSTALLLVVCLGLIVQLTQTVRQPATGAVDYMAVMQAVPAPEHAPAALVITAYQGDAPGRSKLHLQWNERQGPQQLDGLSLWAINRESGEATSLGALDDNISPKLLSKPEWLAIKDSAELVVVRGSTVDGPVLYRGPCLQLSAWQDAGTSS